MADTVTLQFLGAAGTVTGSKFLISSGKRRILVDAGMFQGERGLRDLNWDGLPVDPALIDMVILTHAHADHTAYVPALVDRGFRGPVWCTEATAKLAEIVMLDSAHLQELATEQAIRGGYSKHAEPRSLYTTDDAQRAVRQLRWVPFDEDVELAPGVTARWTRAAHILGSASVHLIVDGVDVLFSGDLGRPDHKLLKPRDTPPGARWVLCESTYGDREHAEPEIPHEEMAATIRRTIARGGSVLIPAFAIDRTQAVMYVLSQMQAEGRIPDVPIIVDGPMSMKALDVYRDMSEEFRDDVRLSEFTSSKQFVEARTAAMSKKLRRSKEPRIIISSSGMLEGGRAVAHLQAMLPDPRNAIILTGFQALGTRGRQLIDGARHVKVFGRHVKRRAEVVQDREFSAHADSSELVQWLSELDPKPELVYLVHGEPAAAEALERRVEEELGLDVVIARLGEKVLLSDMPDDDWADGAPEDLDEVEEG